MAEYGVYTEYMRVLSLIIFYLLQDDSGWYVLACTSANGYTSTTCIHLRMHIQINKLTILHLHIHLHLPMHTLNHNKCSDPCAYIYAGLIHVHIYVRT